jgi:hypothetical protein
VTSIGSFREIPDASHPYSSEMRVRCCRGKVVVFFLFRVGFMIGLGWERFRKLSRSFFCCLLDAPGVDDHQPLSFGTAPYQLSI